MNKSILCSIPHFNNELGLKISENPSADAPRFTTAVTHANGVSCTDKLYSSSQNIICQMCWV